MRKEYTVEHMTKFDWFYKFIEPNAIGEKIILEVIKCVYNGTAKDDKKSLPYLWMEHGYIDRILESYWFINTYVTDTEGNCLGKYNPQVTGKDTSETEMLHSVINFDWMFEATEENKEKIFDEVYRLFSTATGKTATELKYEKIKAFAKRHNVELLTEIPREWEDIGGMTAPIGTTWISNMKPIKNGERKASLLLVNHP